MSWSHLSEENQKEVIDRLNDLLNAIEETESPRVLADYAINIIKRVDLIIGARLDEKVEEFYQDKCSICGANPMTVNCNNAGCDT